MAATTQRAMDLDKENRVPPGMLADSKPPGKHTPGRITPGRARKQTQDQYFDVGKVGRKTGVTLPDHGLRDEYGMEPTAGIFDSPKKSPRRDPNRTLTSSDMHIPSSSALDVDATLHGRRIPHLPPPRASTPKHTHIGSPKRASTGRHPHTTGRALPSRGDEEGGGGEGEVLSRTQPPANRVLDFVVGKGEKGVRRSIEVTSPFKPTRALRRSLVRGDPFASPAEAGKGRQVRSESVADAMRVLEETEVLLSTSDGVVMVEEDPVEAVQYDDDAEVDAEEEEEAGNATLATRYSELAGTPDSPAAAEDAQASSSPSVVRTTLPPSKKRSHASMETNSHDEANVTISEALLEGGASVRPSQKKRRSGPRSSESVLLQDDDGAAMIDPSLLSHGGDQSLLEDSREPSAAPAKKPPAKAKSEPKSKGKSKAAKTPALHPRDSNRPSQPPRGSSRSPSKPRASVGPTHALRATTPFDDAISTSRYGRAVIKPLQYWANESRIWRHGECEGIIRADEVAAPPRSKGRKKNRKRKPTIGKLGDIAEGEEDDEAGSETGSTCPDEWEGELGVISGTVARWDAQTQQGDAADAVREDLAFAAPTLLTRDVPGSAFRYAKILTLPFFGAGVVELPPAGFKRAKNARKMQMVFFVHAGKVMVEVGAPGGGGAQEAEGVNAFAVSRGGVWVVPRGNNYAITNESRTTTAKIFFAQGCEVDGLAGAVEDASR
ncbi:mitotic fidelity of chromosome transmission- protein [Teratosphaeriaceae sp. CCFEE 6253]|nr:mitotic fidelity of chromosome transmission- protein [Teratosphaeriaceae sp. CCFEE 6253]